MSFRSEIPRNFFNPFLDDEGRGNYLESLSRSRQAVAFENSKNRHRMDVPDDFFGGTSATHGQDRTFGNSCKERMRLMAVEGTVAGRSKYRYSEIPRDFFAKRSHRVTAFMEEKKEKRYGRLALSRQMEATTERASQEPVRDSLKEIMF